MHGVAFRATITLLVFQEILVSILFSIHRGSPPCNRVAFVALVSLLGLSSTAYAQPAPAAAPSVKPATAQAPAFRSAFEGYQPYTDDGAPEWKKANDAVGQIGGWRAYAREAQGNRASGTKGEEKNPDQGAQTDPHAGHAKP
jgi:hypothetical protein